MVCHPIVGSEACRCKVTRGRLPGRFPRRRHRAPLGNPGRWSPARTTGSSGSFPHLSARPPSQRVSCPHAPDGASRAAVSQGLNIHVHDDLLAVSGAQGLGPVLQKTLRDPPQSIRTPGSPGGPLIGRLYDNTAGRFLRGRFRGNVPVPAEHSRPHHSPPHRVP